MSAPTYISRDQILAALSALAERDLDVPGLGGVIRLRELTRGQLQDASAAARRGGEADEEAFNLAVFAAGVIDPATRLPLFRVDELLAWRDANPESRSGLVSQVAGAIIELSEVGPEALKSGLSAPAAAG